MLEKLSFEIAETPSLYSWNGELLTSKTHKSIIRATDGFQLSSVKNSYNPMYNEDFMETTNRMAEISGFKNAGYSEIDGGRIVLSHLKNDAEGLKIGGNKIKDYLILGSSFDGSYPFFIGTTTVLIRCLNQFSKISKMEKVRHTKSAPKRREELLTGLKVYFAERQKMYNNFEKMMQVEVDETLKQRVIDYVLEISQEDRLAGEVSTRKLNQVELLNTLIGTEATDLGMNLWGVFNGVTKYTTHHIEQRKESFGNIFGNASKMNSRAYNFALEMAQ